MNQIARGQRLFDGQIRRLFDCRLEVLAAHSTALLEDGISVVAGSVVGGAPGRIAIVGGSIGNPEPLRQFVVLNEVAQGAEAPRLLAIHCYPTSSLSVVG